MQSESSKGAIILNRLDRIPVWPYSTAVLLSVGAGFFFAFFDIVSIGIALPKIEQDFQISNEMAAWAITSSLVGYIIGSFLDSRIADYFGRRPGLYLSILFFSLGSLGCAVSQTFFQLVVWRFISGLGLGAEIALVTAIMGELAPANYRGQYTSRASAFGMLGFALVPFVGMGLVPHYEWGWRILFALGSLGGLVIAFTRWWVPESPRWLIAQGKFLEAKEIVEKAEERARQKMGTELPPFMPQIEEAPIRYGMLHMLRSPYSGRLILFVAIWFFYYLGNYAWLTLSTELLIDKGFELAKSLQFIAIGSLGFILGSLIPVFYGDRIQRKYFAAATAFIWSLVLLAIGWFPIAWIIIPCGFIASITIAAIIPIMYAYTAEHFPTTIRATCISITDGLGHLGGAVCGQVVFGVYALFEPLGYGFPAALSCMALSGFITLILVLFGVNMTGVPLKR
ncbi:MFS transporter [Legionella impletisoli]|uniref:MFS transporter n=1 Tax=Legionella impletisoli TaxID=343510 RepID=A0A917K0G1_9GAMM|nr:MFS transporter [Legionella impletisoli]GGI93320.1 MFS transporter [Legionella impletisoli]